MKSKSAESAKRFMRRWRYFAYSLALGLPLIAILATIAIVFFDPGSDSVRLTVLEKNLSPISYIPLLVVYLNWPYLVLDVIVASKIRRRPEDIASLRSSAIGALIGLTIPYIIGYSFWPAEMASDAPDAGQGIGIILPLLGWVVGPIAAAVGWYRGRHRAAGR